MNTETITTKMEASEEDRIRVQGKGDDDGGGSGSTARPVDWQQQRSVGFTCYRVANSYTISSLLVAALF